MVTYSAALKWAHTPMAYTVSRSIDVTLLYSLEMLAVILEQSITYQTKFRCFAHSTIFYLPKDFRPPPGFYLCLRDAFVRVLVFGRRKNTLYLLWIHHTWSISCFWCQGWWRSRVGYTQLYRGWLSRRKPAKTCFLHPYEFQRHKCDIDIKEIVNLLLVN